jgi:hypothetical protein
LAPEAVVFDVGDGGLRPWDLAAGADDYLTLLAARHEVRRAQAARAAGVQFDSAIGTSIHTKLLGVNVKKLHGGPR